MNKFVVLMVVFSCRLSYGQLLRQSIDQLDNSLYKTPCKTYIMWKEVNVNPYDSIIESRVFNDTVNLYSCPALDSEVRIKLTFNSKINVLSLITLYNRDTIFYPYHNNYQFKRVRVTSKYWYKVLYNKDTLYAIKSDIAVRNDGKHPFLIGSIMSNNDQHMQLRRIDTLQPKGYIDTLDLSSWREYYQMYQLQHIQLLNVEEMYIYRTYRQSCLGGLQDQYIALLPHGMMNLISGYKTEEAGESGKIKIYLPVKLPNGLIRLVAHSQLTVESKEDNLDIFPYPKEYQIPIDELIIKQSIETFTELDKDYNIIYDVTGSPIEKVFEGRPEVYHWNGKTLTLVSPSK